MVIPYVILTALKHHWADLLVTRLWVETPLRHPHRRIASLKLRPPDQLPIRIDSEFHNRPASSTYPMLIRISLSTGWRGKNLAERDFGVRSVLGHRKYPHILQHLQPHYPNRSITIPLILSVPIDPSPAPASSAHSTA